MDLKEYAKNNLSIELTKLEIGNIDKDDLEQLSKSSYYYEKTYNNLVYEKYFITYINRENYSFFKNSKDETKINSHQEELVSREWYSDLKDTRWSHFLLLVCEDQQLYDSITNKEEIERDTCYAIKKVIYKEQLKDILIPNTTVKDLITKECEIKPIDINKFKLGKVNVFYGESNTDIRSVYNSIMTLDNTIELVTEYMAASANRILYDFDKAGLDDVTRLIAMNKLRQLAIEGKQLFLFTNTLDILGLCRRKFSMFEDDYVPFIFQINNKMQVVHKLQVSAEYEEIQTREKIEL